MFLKIYFKWALDDDRANLNVKIGDVQDSICMTS